MSGCSFDNCVSQDRQGYATMHSPQTQRLNTEDYFLSQNPLQLQATLQDIVLCVLTKQSLLPRSFITSTATCATKLAATRKERNGIL